MNEDGGKEILAVERRKKEGRTQGGKSAVNGDGGQVSTRRTGWEE